MEVESYSEASGEKKRSDFVRGRPPASSVTKTAHDTPKKLAEVQSARHAVIIAMGKLYSITTNQESIRVLFRVMNRYVGNLAPIPGTFADYPAPVVRNTGAEREMALMRYGMPPPRRPMPEPGI